MPEEKQSILAQQAPTQMEGPFSSFLTPAPPPQRAQPHTAPNASGGIAYIAQSFLDGATRARQQAYALKEKEHYDKVRQVQARAQELEHPDMTDKGRHMLSGATNTAMLIGVHEAHGGGKKGKKGKKSEGGGSAPPKDPGEGGGQPAADSGSIAGVSATSAFNTILKNVIGKGASILTAATGGKMPTLADIDPDKFFTNAHGKLYNSTPEGWVLKPEFSKSAQTAAMEKEIQENLSALAPGATREQVQRILSPITTKYQAEIGQQAAEGLMNRYVDTFEKQHPSPAPGSEAEMRIRAMKSLGLGGDVPTTAAPPAAPSETRPAGVAPPADPGEGGAVKAQEAAIPTGPMPSDPRAAAVANQKGWNPQRHEWMEILGWAKSGQPQDVEYTGPDGKKVNSMAYWVSSPEFQGFIDANTKEALLAKDVRKVSTAQPRAPHVADGEMKAPAGAVDLWGKPIKPGTLVRTRTSTDAEGKTTVTFLGEAAPRKTGGGGVAANPYTTERLRGLTAQTQALEGIEKMVDQTSAKLPPDYFTAPNKYGNHKFRNIYEYLLEESFQKHYKDDPAVVGSNPKEAALRRSKVRSELMKFSRAQQLEDKQTPETPAQMVKKAREEAQSKLSSEAQSANEKHFDMQNQANAAFDAAFDAASNGSGDTVKIE